MIKTFLMGFIPISLFLFGTIFYTTITVSLVMLAGLLFVSYLIGDSIRSELDRN